MSTSPESSPSEGALHAYTSSEGEFKVSPPSEIREEFDKFSQERGSAPPLPPASLTEVSGSRRWIFAPEAEPEKAKGVAVSGKDRPVFSRARQIYADEQGVELTPTQEDFLSRKDRGSVRLSSLDSQVAQIVGGSE